MSLRNRRGMRVLFMLILLLIILLENPFGVKKVYAYYGFPGTSSLFRYGYPNSGYGLSWNPLYNAIHNPFAFGGSYNLTTSLGGLSTLGGYGGLFGLRNYGTIGGLFGLYGLTGLSGLYGLSPFATSGLGIAGRSFPGGLLPAGLTNPLFAAEQAGAWTGTWNLGFLTGTMIMNLSESITGSLSGTAQLIGNLTFGGIFNVYGTGSTTFVSLNGQDPTLTYAVTLQGILTTPTIMEGFYSIYKIGSTTPKESGTFNLELLI
ncbi:MAG: hypothetical protein ACMUIL_05935 [bacterium]